MDDIEVSERDLLLPKEVDEDDEDEDVDELKDELRNPFDAIPEEGAVGGDEIGMRTRSTDRSVLRSRGHSKGREETSFTEQNEQE